MSIISRVLLIIGLSIASAHLFAMEYNNLDKSDHLFEKIKKVIKELSSNKSKGLDTINNYVISGADLEATREEETLSKVAKRYKLNSLAMALNNKSAWDAAYANKEEFLLSLDNDILEIKKDRLKKSGIDIGFDDEEESIEKKKKTNKKDKTKSRKFLVGRIRSKSTTAAEKNIQIDEEIPNDKVIVGPKVSKRNSISTSSKKLLKKKTSKTRENSPIKQQKSEKRKSKNTKKGQSLTNSFGAKKMNFDEKPKKPSSSDEEVLF